MITIKILLKNVRIIFKKGNRSQGPFPFFFYNKLKHPHVKCSLLFLIVLTCNFQASSNKTTQLPESYVTSHKHNVILILF